MTTASKSDSTLLASALCVALLIHTGAVAGLLYFKKTAPDTLPELMGFEMVDLASVASTASKPVEPEPVIKPVPAEITQTEPVSAPEPPPVAEPLVEETPVRQAVPEEPTEPLVEEPVIEAVASEEPNLVEPTPEIPVADQPVQTTQEVSPPQPQTEPSDTVEFTETVPAVAENNSPTPPTASNTTPPRSDVAYFNNAKPVYPLSARKRRLEGMVLLEVTVDRLGWPEAVFIKESSGHSVLDNAARWAVEKWRFIPATENGNDVAAIVEVPIRFALN